MADDLSLVLAHRYFHSGRLRELLRLRIARVDMPQHAHPRIVRQYTLDARRHLLATVCNGHLPGVLRIADAHPAPLVDRYPGRAPPPIHPRHPHPPIPHCLRAHPHPLPLTPMTTHPTPT